MCSNTQWAGCSPVITGFSSRPLAVSETISPGCTSRIICAPMMSKAQLSEATTKHSPKPSLALILPSASAQLLLVEDLRDQAQLPQRRDVAALAAGNPGRLLAAMLECVEREVRKPRHIAARRVYAEHPALIVRAIAIGNVETRVGHVCG